MKVRGTWLRGRKVAPDRAAGFVVAIVGLTALGAGPFGVSDAGALAAAGDAASTHDPLAAAALSETGLFQSVSGLVPAEGVRPYAVAVELWSDGAKKERWFRLPPGGRLNGSTDGPLFPMGTVFIKHFEAPRAGGPARRIETRVSRQTESGWEGVSFLWNAEGSDAVRTPNGATIEIEIQDAPAVGERKQRWRLPSQSECRSCHNRAAGFTLGFRASQLMGPAGQWARWTSIFDVDPSSKLDPAGAWPPIHDESRPLRERAKAYLDVNCAFCHAPQTGAAPPGMDLRWSTPLEGMGLVGQRPLHGSFGLPPGARKLAPGRPELSVLHARVAARVPGRMPLGSQIPDPDGVALIKAWIESER